jgi:RNA polymerase sigma factor (TIGR02999 family)
VEWPGPSQKKRSGVEAGRVTQALAEMRDGSEAAREELFQLVYAELRRVADSQMRKQPPGHTLQPTALVHETYLRLLGGQAKDWNDRGHFLASATRAMRSILVDIARQRATIKRGGERRRLTLDEDRHGWYEEPDSIIAVHDAMARLEQVDAQWCRVVEARFFGGLTVEETAQVLGISEATVYRAWDGARGWLYREVTR